MTNAGGVTHGVTLHYPRPELENKRRRDTIEYNDHIMVYVRVYHFINISSNVPLVPGPTRRLRPYEKQVKRATS